MKRIFGLVVLCFVVLLSLSTEVKAAQWKNTDGGWWYEFDDGTWPENRWLKIDGKWYYFGDDGYMVKEQWVGDYYLGLNGDMLVNTVTPDGTRVGPSGKKVTRVSR